MGLRALEAIALIGYMLGPELSTVPGGSNIAAFGRRRPRAESSITTPISSNLRIIILLTDLTLLHNRTSLQVA